MNNYRLFHAVGVSGIVAFVCFLGVVVIKTYQGPARPAVASPSVEVSSSVKEITRPMFSFGEDFLALLNLEPLEEIPPQSESDYTAYVLESETQESQRQTVSAVELPASKPQTIVISPSTSAARSSSSGSSLSGGSTASSSSSVSASASGGESDVASVAGITTGTPVSKVIYEPQNIAVIFPSAEDIAQGMPYSKALNNMLRYDAYWYAQAIAHRQPQVWRTLRTEYSERLAMFYISSCTVVKGYSGNYLDYDYVEKNHPEWFLLKDEQNATIQDYRDPDRRIRWNPNDPEDDYYNRFYLDVGNPAFQAWAVEEFLKKLKPVIGVKVQIPYSGLLAENVSLSNIAYSWRREYPNWKYASNPRDWRRNFCFYLDKIKGALNPKGYILIANTSVNYQSSDAAIRADFIDLLDSVNGMARECALGQSTQQLAGGEKWEHSLSNHETVISEGLYDWWVYDPKVDEPIEDRQRFLYVYCSFLLVKDAALSLFGTHNSKSISWYEEYELPLGNPLGMRYQIDGCWLRDYQYGKVVVNPSGMSCIIPLDSETYTLDWQTKKVITQLALEPLSATILLPTGYSIQ